MNKKELGKWGEDYALTKLKKEGYSLIVRNFTSPYGELDLVMKKDRSLCFVEVKTKRGLEFGLPREEVTEKKLNHIKKAVLYYLNRNSNNLNPIFLYVAEVIILPEEIKFELIQVVKIHDS